MHRQFGFYLHIPFCATRCGYCDFNTYTAADLGGGAAEQYQVGGGQGPHRDAAGPSHVGVHGGEKQRPGDAAEDRQRHDGQHYRRRQIIETTHSNEPPKAVTSDK